MCEVGELDARTRGCHKATAKDRLYRARLAEEVQKAQSTLGSLSPKQGQSLLDSYQGL